MTRADILFLIGSMLIISGSTYAMWVKVRVVRLRQDIFDKRDALFDVADNLDAFSDVGYRAAREHLNSLAHLAKYLSISLIIHASPRSEKGEAITSDIPEMQQVIDEIFEWSGKRIVRYLLRETATGLLLSCLLGIKDWQSRRMDYSVESWVRSDVPVELDRLRRESNSKLSHTAAHA